jgi:hypothetical protein
LDLFGIPLYIPLSKELEKQYAATISKRFVPLVRACLFALCLLETGEAISNYLVDGAVYFPHSCMLLVGFYLILLAVSFTGEGIKIIQSIAVIGIVGVVFSMGTMFYVTPNGIDKYALAFFVPLQVIPLMPSFHAALAAIILSTAVIFDFAAHTGVPPETQSYIRYVFTYYGLICSVISYSAAQYRRASFKLEKNLELAKKEAEAATAAKSVFLATMSHEVRTPLNGILGIITLIKDTKLDALQTDYLDTIKYSGETLLTILNDILDFSKMEAGKFDLEDIGFNLDRLLASVVTLMKSRGQEKGLRLDYKIDADVPAYITSDPTRIRQVLLNLIGNAIKFTDNGFVHVQVSCTNKDEANLTVRFEVSDSGIGIPEAAQKNLFQEFAQADTSTSRKYGGTGLGLAICMKIVKLMRGDIGVLSQAGKGSTFWFEIMAKTSDTAEVEGFDAGDHATSDQIPDFRPLSVLVAEDNKINQKVITGLLARAGHTVTIAENGEEALSSLTKSGASFDLILMDMQMPVMDGLSAAAKIRVLEDKVRDIPIIALTANNIKGDEQRCLAAGMNGYVSKPIDSAALYHAISELVPNAIIAGSTKKPIVPASSDKKGFENLEELQRMMGPEYMKQFTQEGLTEIESLIELLCKGAGNEDVRRAAHDLKGLCTLFGLHDVQALAEGIEMSCAENSNQESVVLIKLLEDRYQENVAVLRRNYLSA